MTIIAPVFEILIFVQAEIIDLMLVVFLLISCPPLRKFTLSNTDPFFAKFVQPIINKNFLLSGWNTTISAIIPTLINPPIILESKSISINAEIRHTK